MIDNLKQQIIKLEHLYDSSYIDWKNDEIIKEQFQRIRTDTEQKLNQVRTNLEKLIVEQCQFGQGIKSNNSYFETFLKYQNVET